MYVYQTAFDLDLSGRNPDNLVKNEPHKLSTKLNRAIVPLNGLFYENSLVVMDLSKPLIRNVDYICVEMHDGLTYKTKQAVFSGLIITNPKVSQNVTITYQVVGGPYTNDNKAIENLYQSVINDSRPVHWNNLTGVPTEFPPSDHFHQLNDVVGWTPIIHQLERLNITLGLSSVDITKKIVNSLVGDFPCGQLEKNLPNSKLVQYDALLHTLSERKLLSQVSVKTELCTWTPGGMAHFDVDTTNIPVGTKLFWSFYKENNSSIDIGLEMAGVVEGNGGVVRVTTYVPGSHSHEKEVVYVGVKLSLTKDDYDAVTYKIFFNRPLFANSTYGLMANVKHFESDETSMPALYNTSPHTRLKYLLDHVSPIKHKSVF